MRRIPSLLRGAVWMLVGLAAAPDGWAQATLSLVGPGTSLRDVFPTTRWGVTPYEQAPPTFPGDDDWPLAGATVEVDVQAPAGLDLGACDLVVSWDDAALTWARFVPNASVFPGDATFVLPTTGSVRVSMARLGDNVGTGAGLVLGTLRFTLLVPASTAVSLVSADCRTFDGVGGQAYVSVAPGLSARIGVVLGDVAARTSSGFDATRADGTVDFEDLQVLLAGYRGRSDPGFASHPLYRLKLDLASRPGDAAPQDGQIDFEDLQALLARYRTQAFPP